MSRPTSLMGLGMSPFLGNELGYEPVLVAAAGNSQTTAAVANNDMIEMTATGADGVILPDVGVSNWVFVFNSSGSTGLVYVPVGHTLNTTLNGSLSVATHKGAILWQYKRLFWASVLSA